MNDSRTPPSTEQCNANPSLPNRIVTDPVRPVMIALVLPVLAEQFLNTLVGLVDVYLAGNLANVGVEATSAVGLASYVGWLVTMIFALVGTGTTALVARAWGQGDRSQANKVANQSILLASILGFLAVAGLFLIAPLFAGWQNMTGRTYDIAVFYLQVDAFGHLGAAVTLVAGAALRGVGDMRTPMKVLVLVNIINIVLSCCLVHGFGPFPSMGVNGIVTGTLCARLLGGAIILAILLSGRSGIILQRKLLLPAWTLTRRILRIGIPAAVDGALMWTGHFIFLMIIARLTQTHPGEPNHAYAAHIVVVRLEAFTYLPANAWAAACATMIGQALGAKLPHRARKCGYEGAIQCGLLTSVVGLVFILFARPLCNLMHSDATTIDLAVPVLILAGAFQPILAVAIAFIGSLRGAGDTLPPLVINTICLALLRIPIGYVLGMVLGLGLFGAWIGVCVDLSFRTLLLLIRYRQGRWITVRV